VKFRKVIIALVLLLAPLQADAWIHGITLASLARSQLVLRPLGPTPGAEYPLLNLFKESSRWNYSVGGAPLLPTDLDSNGYPSTGANAVWQSNGGASTGLNTPAQATRPGNYTLIWTGGAKFQVGFNGSGVNRLTSCIGTGSNFGNAARCDNTACSTFTGSIAGTTLTVTAAPTGTGCTLGAGVPISSASIPISKFGTPTIITSAGSSCGPNTCYTVNISQTATSGTIVMGGRFETNITTPFPTTTSDAWAIQEISTNNSPQTAANFAFLFTGTGGAGAGDETLYWNSAAGCGNGQACIVGQLFKSRIKQGNFATLRDLDWIDTNTSNCSTWSSRKTLNYSSYANNEFRDAPAGTDADGYLNAGQYVNSAGTGASGGTISYVSDTYSITLGSGAPVDKQSIIILPPSTGTTSSTINLNGTGAVSVANGAGSIHSSSALTVNIPALIVYDANLNLWLQYGGTSAAGLNCPVPPEVFVEINAELGTNPWHSIIYLALDPMTDWVKQYATYIKNNYNMKPWFEVSNEPFNFNTSAPCYLSNKSTVWITDDPTAWQTGAVFCGGNGNNLAEIGKMGNTVGQDLNTVYGAGNYELLVPVQTYGGANQSNYKSALQSTQYLAQTLIPVQSGYNNTNATYKYATRVSINTYWNNGYYGGGASNIGLETGLAYCYYNYSISATCQGLYVSQAAIMTTLFNSNSLTSGVSSFNAALFAVQAGLWNTWAAVCSSSGARFSGCTLNLSAPLAFYEGGFNESTIGADATQAITAATNDATGAVLTTANPNGCVIGQTVNIANFAGGTWSTADGSYAVTAVPSSTQCKLGSLDSSGLGTFSSGTLTYTGSQGYINYLRTVSYLAPDLDTWTTTLYNSAIVNGGINPSQYWMASSFPSSPWLTFSYDLYGYFPVGKCTGCTISSTTLTLGGTITNVFRVGDTLLGGGVTGIGTGAGSMTTITSCTPVGGNVCGTTSGDTLGLSQASTVASGTTMTSNAAPGAAGSGLVSPVRSWHAICNWNGNGAAC